MSECTILSARLRVVNKNHIFIRGAESSRHFFEVNSRASSRIRVHLKPEDSYSREAYRH